MLYFSFVGSGILYYLIPDIPIFAGRNSPPLLATAITICTTGITNLILTSLISGRVWFHQQRMRRILGPQYGSPYHRLIITCVESCFLIVITFLAFVVLFALGVRVIETAIIPLLLLPHICVSTHSRLITARAKAFFAGFITHNDCISCCQRTRTDDHTASTEHNTKFSRR